ncbi:MULTISPECIES: hypothetical protein [Cytobacillus]|uniref:Oxalate:formate antiporter n=1 Tax=Cytobacillus kochii TaxID=859143 RepID=A0A248TGH7_9BACI|nr:hypothetical protein [Cytobacillus kochii]ASV67275.1 hypothetical protein CKF48_08055 [Cytobacillus kochii]
MRKKNHSVRDLIYILLNEKDQSVISYGIEFSEFMQSLQNRTGHLLLVKHQYDNGELNVHTMFDWVAHEDLPALINEDVYSYGDFCWIDFEEEESLNELPAQAIAELLYLSHVKEHLKKPFYNHLSNRYCYLAHDDGWLNKVYYRDWQDFYKMLGDVAAMKMEHLKVEKSLLGLKKKKTYPQVPEGALRALRNLMKEGLVISFEQSEQTRTKINIPLWTVGDFTNMDDMYDEFEAMRKEATPDARLVFDKKLKEWQVTDS